MIRISSNSTLFWKIFLPTFWFTFYGVFTIALWTYKGPEQGLFLNKEFRLGLTIFYAVGSFLIYFTVLQVKRVEYKEEYFYVTNYFRTIKIPFDLIRYIDKTSYTIFRRGKVYLYKETPFGKSFTFIVYKRTISELEKQYPELFIYKSPPKE